MSKLSLRQKSFLSQIARRAFNYIAGKAKARGETFDTSSSAFDEFRREQVYQVCGCYGLRQAESLHYNAIASKFESLAGNEGRAFEHLLRESSDRKRQLEARLLAELAGAGMNQSYAERISQGRFKRSVADCNEEQLTALVMTVKSRACSKRRKKQVAA